MGFVFAFFYYLAFSTQEKVIVCERYGCLA